LTRCKFFRGDRWYEDVGLRIAAAGLSIGQVCLFAGSFFSEETSPAYNMQLAARATSSVSSRQGGATSAASPMAERNGYTWII